MCTRLFITTFIIALMLNAQSAYACATCFGAEGDPQTEGLNAAIITLLGVTYTLFIGMAVTAFYYSKKNTANMQLENTEHESESIDEAPNTNG